MDVLPCVNTLFAQEQVCIRALCVHITAGNHRFKHFATTADDPERRWLISKFGRRNLAKIMKRLDVKDKYPCDTDNCAGEAECCTPCCGKMLCLECDDDVIACDECHERGCSTCVPTVVCYGCRSYLCQECDAEHERISCPNNTEPPRESQTVTQEKA